MSSWYLIKYCRVYYCYIRKHWHYFFSPHAIINVHSWNDITVLNPLLFKHKKRSQILIKKKERNLWNLIFLCVKNTHSNKEVVNPNIYSHKSYRSWSSNWFRVLFIYVKDVFMLISSLLDFEYITKTSR